MKTIFRSLGLWKLVSICFHNSESTENLNAAQKKTLKESQERMHMLFQKFNMESRIQHFPGLCEYQCQRKLVILFNNSFMEMIRYNKLLYEERF